MSSITPFGVQGRKPWAKSPVATRPSFIVCSLDANLNVKFFNLIFIPKLPINIFFRINSISDGVSVDGVLRVRGHLNNNSVDVWILVQLIQLEKNLIDKLIENYQLYTCVI